MCLILKARESAPKRGYFYRSWMMLVNIVAMAKDLELDQHMELHKMGQPCGFSIYDCVCKSRIWLVLYTLEAMIGGPQGMTFSAIIIRGKVLKKSTGRHDFSVLTDTIDFEPPQPIPGFDETEMQISRQWSYLVRIIKNIRQSILLYAKLRKTKEDWALDPEFANHDQDFPLWLSVLPRDLQIVLPADGSPPYLPSTFVANMHCYHYLSTIMHHRPQIRSLENVADENSRKRHMIICHDAAKKMCRIQESILQNFGLHSMLLMQRGMSFTIYCVLTCTMMHLVSDAVSRSAF